MGGTLAAQAEGPEFNAWNSGGGGERMDSTKMTSDGWGPHLHTGTHTNNR